MHGSLSDMRAYLPLSELQDAYYVIMWDQRGNGLSERVTEEELSYDAMVEEIEAVRTAGGLFADTEDLVGLGIGDVL